MNHVDHIAKQQRYVVRRPDGFVAGAATDVEGRWSWWATSTGGRRITASSEAEAVHQITVAGT